MQSIYKDKSKCIQEERISKKLGENIVIRHKSVVKISKNDVLYIQWFKLYSKGGKRYGIRKNV